MKRAWQIASLAFIVLSAVTLAFSFAYPYKDKLGPGPGFFPFWLGLITGALSLALFFEITWVHRLKEVATLLLPTRQGALRILVIMVALLGCLVLLDPLGFRISLFLFLLFLPPGLGARNWGVILLFALAGSFAVFHVFYYWLQVPLPMGVLGI